MEIEIVADPVRFWKTGATGYYLVRVIDPSSGKVVGQWDSIPINGGREIVVTLTLGGRVYIEQVRELESSERAKLASGEALRTPNLFKLHSNYPNPFNPETTVAFDLPTAGWVDLAIYNLNGQLVRVLVSGERSAGHYTVIWDGRDDAGQAVASGVYLCRIVAGDYSAARKMLLVK